MRSRFRVMAALFALLALTLSFAEGVSASTCMPGMDMGMDSSAEAAAASGRMDEMTTPGRNSGDESPDRPAPPHCPFAPVSTPGSCVVAASLPATSSVDLAPSPEGALLVSPPEQTRDLLLVSTLFHPPRA